jgi:hypothetical protein
MSKILSNLQTSNKRHSAAKLLNDAYSKHSFGSFAMNISNKSTLSNTTSHIALIVNTTTKNNF